MLLQRKRGYILEKNKDKKYIIYSILSIVTGLLIWHLATDVFKVFTPNELPSPVQVVKTFFVKMYDPKPDGATIPQHLISSLQVALSGYFLGALIGIPLGIIMAWYRRVDMFVRPLFDLLRPIPGIAWIPVMIMVLGIGLLSKAMVVFLSAFIACVINTYTGIKQTKIVHLWVAQTFGASNFETLIKVAIPTSLPMILAGLRISLGASWTTLVAAELLASTRGLGFMIQQCRGIFRPDVIIAGMISIGGTGAFLAHLITLLERKMLKGGRW